MEGKLRFIVAESCIWAPVNYDITWSYNGLSPTQPQCITYTNSSLLLIEPFGKKKKIWIKTTTFFIEKNVQKFIKFIFNQIKIEFDKK